MVYWVYHIFFYPQDDPHDQDCWRTTQRSIAKAPSFEDQDFGKAMTLSPERYFDMSSILVDGLTIYIYIYPQISGKLT